MKWILVAYCSTCTVNNKVVQLATFPFGNWHILLFYITFIASWIHPVYNNKWYPVVVYSKGLQMSNNCKIYIMVFIGYYTSLSCSKSLSDISFTNVEIYLISSFPTTWWSAFRIWSKDVVVHLWWRRIKFLGWLTV